MPELPIECHECDEDGYTVTCIDDLCRNSGECMHGDGYKPCPRCKGKKEYAITVTQAQYERAMQYEEEFYHDEDETCEGCEQIHCVCYSLEQDIEESGCIADCINPHYLHGRSECFTAEHCEALEFDAHLHECWWQEVVQFRKGRTTVSFSCESAEELPRVISMAANYTRGMD